MTDTHDLQKIVHYLQARIDTLEIDLKETKKELEDSENAYESLHNESENLEIATKDYLDNKEFFDQVIVRLEDIKLFFSYIKEECEVKPENEHVYRCYFSEMRHAVDLLKGV
jgi:hypothetical protein